MRQMASPLQKHSERWNWLDNFTDFVAAKQRRSCERIRKTEIRDSAGTNTRKINLSPITVKGCDYHFRSSLTLYMVQAGSAQSFLSSQLNYSKANFLNSIKSQTSLSVSYQNKHCIKVILPFSSLTVHVIETLFTNFSLLCFDLKKDNTLFFCVNSFSHALFISKCHL